ncbi:hypothetical protein OF83DRAFT_1087882, partial [Amylostereum chailletii]
MAPKSSKCLPSGAQPSNLKKPSVATPDPEPKPRSRKASGTTKKLSALEKKQLADAQLYDRNPIPVKATMASATESTDETDNISETRRGGRRVDYRTLHGTGPTRRSSSQVAAEKAEKQATRAAATALEQASIKDFARYEKEVEEKRTYERAHATDPPVPSRTKVRYSLDRAPTSEPEPDEDSDEPTQDSSEQGECDLPDVQGEDTNASSTATTPATTDADEFSDDDSSEDKDDMSMQSAGRGSKRGSVSDGSKDSMDIDEEKAVEQDEDEALVATRRISTKKGVLIRKQVEQECRESSPAVAETLPIQLQGRKRATTVTAIQRFVFPLLSSTMQSRARHHIIRRETSKKKLKEEKKANAGARPGFSKEAVTRHRPTIPRIDASAKAVVTPIAAQYGGLSESEEEGPKQHSAKAAKGTGVESKVFHLPIRAFHLTHESIQSMAKIERRVVALPSNTAKPSTSSTSKVFTHGDLPEEVKKHWSVYQATLTSYVGSLSDVSNPFIIDNIVGITKTVFKQIYPSSRLLMKRIAPKEAVYELSLNSIRSWRTKFRTQSTTVLKTYLHTTFGASDDNADSIADYINQ